MACTAIHEAPLGRSDCARPRVKWVLIALLLAPGVASGFYAGADISGLSVLEGAGATYSDGGVVGKAEEILADHGVNWFRLRLFVDPSNNSDPFAANDLAYTIDLAKRAKAVGGKLLLDLHYSDTWADPGHQAKPAAWAGLNFTALTQRVREYTQQTVEAFKAEGVTPEMVQIGNEISNGLLWSEGSPWTGGSNNTGFDRLAALLQAGSQGAKAGAGPGQEPLIMIHHDRGDRWATTSYYFNKLVQRNVDFDVIGYSYYPKFHYDPATGAGGLEDFAENLNNTALTYGKPVVIAETGFASRGQQFEPTYEFPVSEQGQRDFLSALLDTVQAVPNGLGAGLFWWFAEARPAPGLPVWEGGRYGLFNQNGGLLSAAREFERFLSPTPPGDFNLDGLVDAADYTVWRDGLGTTYTQADYATWASNFGNSPGALSGASEAPAPGVPEPTALQLLGMISLVVSAHTLVPSSRAPRSPK